MQAYSIGIAGLLFAACTATVQGAPVADAAEQRNWAEVSALAQKKADLNELQGDGSSALLWAVHHDNADAAALLIDLGANVNAGNRYGITPLAEAALNGNVAIVEKLIAAGADVEAALPGGDTPLMIASRTGSAGAVKALLARGASVAARESWHGETALMWAAGENHPDVIRLLAAAGADLNASSATFDWKDIKHGGVQSQLPLGGLTALIHAARQNAYEAAIALLDVGADPNAKDPQGISPLRVAISNGHLDLASMLLERGADPNEGALVEAIKVRTTPMMRAATNRPNKTTPVELINALFAKGATADSVASVALPKKDAFEAGSPAGVAPSETALYIASGAQDLELMKLLIAKGADAKRATDKGATPLMAATGVTVKRPAMAGATVVSLRSAQQRIEAASLILGQGADVNARDVNGLTVLHAMARQGEDDIVSYLVSQGARLDIKDNSHRTPLDVASAVVPLTPAGVPTVFPDPRDAPVRHDSTVAVLRKLMADARVAEVPYSIPGKAVTAQSSAPKPVTAILGPEAR